MPGRFASLRQVAPPQRAAPRRDAPPRPSAHGGSASHTKGPAGQASLYHLLQDCQALPAGRSAIFLRVRHRDTRGNGERRVEVPAQREFLSLESNLPLTFTFLCTLGLRVVLVRNATGRRSHPYGPLNRAFYWAVALGQNSRGRGSKGARGVCRVKGVCGVKGVCRVCEGGEGFYPLGGAPI